MKTDLDDLNEFLIQILKADRIGLRRKVVIIEQWLKVFKERARKSKRSC